MFANENEMFLIKYSVYTVRCSVLGWQFLIHIETFSGRQKMMTMLRSQVRWAAQLAVRFDWRRVQHKGQNIEVF